MNKSESIIELSKALAKFQGEIKQPKKNGTNPHFKSRFATLDDVVKSITETSSKYGLSFVQFPLNDEDKVGVKTIIMHESGEWIEGEPIYTKPMKNDPQALGAVLTYLRRYSLSAIFGVVSDEDDDSESAMDRGTNNSQPQQYKPKYNNSSSIQKPLNAQEAAAIVMPFGKHKGKTLRELFTSESNYIKWLLEQDNTDENIKEAIDLMNQALALQVAQQKMNQ